MTPYEAVYGCPAPSLNDYVSGTSSIDAIDTLMTDRFVLLRRLKDHLLHAQTCMRNKANAHRSDVEFVSNCALLNARSRRNIEILLK